MYGMLPEKSKKLYELSYNHFKTWCKKHGAKEVTENVLLAYFAEKSEHWTSSSLYSEYSKLKTSLAVRGEGDIKRFTKLTEFLKKKSVGYRAKKSRIFSRSEINKFLLEAPDETYLMKKVVLIFGIAGACCSNEFVQMTVDNIEDRGTFLIINVPQPAANKIRSFVIDGIRAEVNLIEIYRKYVSLRPKLTTHRRFFMSYKNGKCFNQTVGVNYFGKIPREIAKYLKLENPSGYNGYCYRRTSNFLRRNGGWPSVTMAECRFGEDVQEIDSDDDVVLVKQENLKLEQQDVNETSSDYQVLLQCNKAEPRSSVQIKQEK